MGTKETNISEEEAMNKLLYIIRDHLPKAAVVDLHKFIGKIESVKSITDMKAFLIIDLKKFPHLPLQWLQEFYTKIDADAARVKGFEYTLNGQNQKIDFATAGVVAVYMAEACKTVGTGF